MGIGGDAALIVVDRAGDGTWAEFFSNQLIFREDCFRLFHEVPLAKNGVVLKPKGRPRPIRLESSVSVFLSQPGAKFNNREKC